MIKRFSALVFFLILAIQPALSQTDHDWRTYSPNENYATQDSSSQTRKLEPQRPGKIKLIEDPRIESLNEKKIENPTKLNGYRVQIFFGNRSKAQEMRGEFIRRYPDEKAYISYLAPNFRLRVGDFRTRIECEKFRHEINPYFQGSYIVKDKIELPALWDENAAAATNE